MTMASEFLMKNKSQTEDYNQIKLEVKKLIEENSNYRLKNISYDGVSEGLDKPTNYFGWFVELMDYSVSMELLQLLHNYFGGSCRVATTNTVSNGGITIIFVYDNIDYVAQNWEDEHIV